MWTTKGEKIPALELSTPRYWLDNTFQLSKTENIHWHQTWLNSFKGYISLKKETDTRKKVNETAEKYVDK